MLFAVRSAAGTNRRSIVGTSGKIGGGRTEACVVLSRHARRRRL